VCGIVGVVDAIPGFKTSAEAVVAMATRLTHRGPDSEGFWADAAAGFATAHRRLAVVELSEAGAQPMVSQSGRWVLSFNGEIYNHKSMREALNADGVARAWRGTSDTETLLETIESLGFKEAISRAVGMFAIAAWDRHEKCLYLARDRLGEKPLYYGWSDRSFVFASELKAIEQHPGWRPDIDRDALCLYFRHGYVPAPFTVFKDVWKLPPGNFLRITPADVLTKSVEAPHVYWRLSPSPVTSTSDVDDIGAVESLEGLLTSAIDLQRVADVPLGVFLSGGIDSSLIASIMQERSSSRVQSFTIGFDEADYDESRYARSVAQSIGTVHSELILTSAQARDVIPLLPEIYDEPFADSSQIPTYLVSKLARSTVTVALSGDGGDELFGGYNRYFLGRGVRNYLMKLPFPMRKAISNLVLSCPPNVLNRLLRPLANVFSDFNVTLPSHKAYKAADVLGAGDDQAGYRRLVSHWTLPSEVVIGGVEPTSLLDRLIAESSSASTPEQWMMTTDTLTYLPDDILVKVDRASMAVSLETRAPFLDHRVVEFSASLPLNKKLRGGKGKWLLRQALFKRVPEALFDRPKMGFALPIDSWLRGPLRPWAEELLHPDRLRAEGLLWPEPIMQKWKEHLSGKRNWQGHLWTVLMFQAWLEARRS
jgi:asparagine synthase (glutamine-hydrolysing)